MSNSIANPSRVYISSNDRDPDQNPANFSVTLPATIENAKSFEVVSFAFPNIFFPFAEDESVLYFAIYNPATLVYAFYAMNMGILPLADSEIPRLPASAYAGGTNLAGASSPTNSGYFRIFPGGLLATPDPNVAPAAQNRYAINDRAFANGQDLADYIQALLRSVAAADIVNNTGAASAPAYNALAGGATPNVLNNVDFDGYASMIPSPLTNNGSFSLVFYRSDPAFTQMAILGSIDANGGIRGFNMNVKLGFTDLVDSSPVAVHLYEYAQNPLNLTRTQDVYVTSSLVSAESLSSNGRRDILFKVPLTSPFGTIVNFQTTLDGTAVSRLPNLIRSIELTLLDDNFDPLTLPDNAVVSMEVHFKFELTPDAQGAMMLR